MFDEMLAIKRFREQQAELALLRQRQRRAEAEDKVETARVSLAKYQDWAQEHERALFRELCERIVRPRDIQDVLGKVAEMKLDESQYASALEAARETLEQEIVTLGERREEHVQTVRMTGKFLELAQSHWDEMAQQESRKEDGALEEVASLLWERPDSDDNGDEA
ncbi:type III secretion system stalk subunit SctO [Bordetella sp. 02P26C-1]|uniref:type III secretion system stalk subunit SctO n=1 Tax=Bordetella sp. 02P26C-1 TaxID=2683195 RepID=UPI001352A4F0|nr:YscO family type III secretion system apparatus protein [Bordetella sp. 02P26C-1]MVW78585.1 YscO family type III secretion system apparatus protein [Bordetella sp. 02P26C-1]